MPTSVSVPGLPTPLPWMTAINLIIPLFSLTPIAPGTQLTTGKGRESLGRTSPRESAGVTKMEQMDFSLKMGSRSNSHLDQIQTSS